MNRRLFALIVLAAALCFLAVQAFADLPIFPNKTPKQMYFRIVTHGGDDPYWAVVQQGMLDACGDLGAKADMDFCGADMALQLKRFKEAVAMGCDGIGLVLNDDKVWDAPVAEALAKGIPVVSLDTDDTEGAKGNPRLCFIGQDERNAGRMIAARVFAKGKEKGVNFKKAHVAMSVEQPGANYGVMRSDGVKDIMKEYGITSFEIIDAGGLEQATVQSRQTSYLLGHPETTFFIGLGGICTDRIAASLEAAGYKPGQDFGIALDCASSELFDEGGRKGYKFWKSNPDKLFSADDLIKLFAKWVAKYPIISIEDPLDQNDWEGYAKFTKALGGKIQIVGDDFFVTNPERLAQGIAKGCANSILIKVNQIGTLTETLAAIEMAHKAGYTAVVSHRSGETEDSTIADVVVATNAGQIKTGSASRTDRVCKYNQLLRIEEELGSAAVYAGRDAFRYAAGR